MMKIFGLVIGEGRTSLTCRRGQLEVLRLDTVRLKSRPARESCLVWGILGSNQLRCCLPRLVQSSTSPVGCFWTVVDSRWEDIFCLVRFTTDHSEGSRLTLCQAEQTLQTHKS